VIFCGGMSAGRGREWLVWHYDWDKIVAFAFVFVRLRLFLFDCINSVRTSTVASFGDVCF
jgi:hypothetical protein